MNTELYLTDRCNMKCAFCGSWNQQGVRGKLDIETIQRYLHTLHKKGYRYLSLSGGEPFLYEQLLTVIAYANQKGFLIQVTTNGLSVNQEYLSFVRNKNVITRVSLPTLDRGKYAKVTGVDALDRAQEAIQRLCEQECMFGIGMTLWDENVHEIPQMAEYGAAHHAKYIRYTPVYRVYKGVNFSTTSKAFLEILKKISQVLLERYEELDMRAETNAFDEEMLNLYLTKPCGAGSNLYVALNPDRDLVACPVLPNYFALPVKKYTDYAAMQAFQAEYEHLRSSIHVDQLEGKCGECLYKTICRGGCISTKIGEGLSFTSEQPVCIYQIVQEVLASYSTQERKKLMQYWNYWNQKYARGASQTLGCMRRLPIWEVHFRGKKSYQK